MQIGSWASLWFGLTLPAIILMYLFKRTYMDIPVTSHLLWRRVLRNVEANRPWQKLQNRLLLWLQLLAAALLVVALMQPVLPGGSKAPKHVLLIADVSGSMSTTKEAPEGDGEEYSSRMSEMKQAIRTFIHNEAAGSEVTLLATGSEPEVLLAGEMDDSRLTEEIDQLQPFYGKTAYRETISLAASLTRGETDTEVVVFTDGDWKEASQDILFDVPVRVQPIEAGQAVNAAIQQFGVKAAQEDKVSSASSGSHVTGVTTILNSSNERVEGALNLYGDGKLLLSRQVQWEPKQRASYTFNRLEPAKVYRLQLDTKDDYHADNEAYAFLSPGSNKRVLFIAEGEGNWFLDKGLRLAGAEVVRLQWKSGDGQTPPLPAVTPDLVVVEGSRPPFLSSGAWLKLSQQHPLWEIGASSAAGQQPGIGKIEMLNHPVTRYVSFDGIYIDRIGTADQPAWAQAIVSAGGKGVIWAGTEQGQPRLQFNFSLEDSDLPLKPEFPILISNSLAWLESSAGAGIGRGTAGTAMDVPVALDAVQASWVPVSGLAAEQSRAAIPLEKGKQGFVSMQRLPDVPGLYALEQKGADGQTSRRYLAVTPDPAEGDLQVQKSPDKLFAPGDSVVPPTEHRTAGASQTQTSSGQEITLQDALPWMRMIAGAVLLLIAAEWGVYQRGRSI
ncbi:VWA domain-containing protein [Paenibacillus sp. JX-17]|uniref:VWA domain-containing protein n=1 Tax=Paenibacillus lacisoli TaxID=3064525 RepID=A0ABT9CDI5_9BACL|nr:VWA domain-containing protein [Paenibacillus sp. JX-17]MDO7907312.1 VWA domain-containing protein [Paenibacillus sp. JX-17]